MDTNTQLEVSYVVRDDSGRVVVIFHGTDAQHAAGEWAERGYQVTPTVFEDGGAPGATRRAVS